MRIGRLALFVLALLLFLSLWPWGSYDPQDADYLAGGLPRDGVTHVHNLAGWLGAYVSRALLLHIGFAAYPVSVLLLLSSIRRLFRRAAPKRFAWEYAVALLLVTVGCSMFFGIWPDMFASAADALNIARTPGGVLGQRFCAPQGGWMRIILNPTGSAVVALAIVVGGLVVVWLHDWHDLATGWFKRLTESDPEEAADVAAKKAKAEARKARRAEARRERQAKAKAAKAAKAAPPDPAPVPASTAAAEEPPARPAARRRSSAKATYRLPPPSLLREGDGAGTLADPKETEDRKEILQETLDSFGIDAEVGNATCGPRVTLFEVLPAPGVKVERISQISNNIAMELRATSLRILTPIPGKNSVGIEVPNSMPAMVSLHSLLISSTWKKSKCRIPVVLGRDISGKVVVLDLSRAPHLLIAGATGSGKSVCINLLIMSLMYRFSPEELRLIMVDPKVVEFRAYESLPHLVVPVISDVKKVPLALRWVINEMQHRYKVFAKVGARNLQTFNSRTPEAEPVPDDEGNPIPARLPYIVVVVDELADIMMTAKADVETSLARIAQLSRAVGIHTIIATQRPSVNVITGTIKANFPTRIAFKVTSQVDSRTILDGKGAEALLGQGDMLFRPPGAAGMERIQGGLVEDDEIEKVVGFCAEQAEQEFDDSVLKVGAGDGDGPGRGPVSDADEELVQRAIEVILRDRRATTSYIQRALRIGYNRAATVIEILEERGVVGPQVGTAPREILISGGPGDDDPDAEDEQPGGDGDDLV